MAEPEPPKYRAFLSYSHRDSRAAARWHAGLERFRIDADLAGRDTARGRVPASLRPVFRDRAEFDAGGSLAAETRAALDGSAGSMTTLRDRLVKIGARIVRHGRSITFQMAEVMVSRDLFQQILDAIAALRPLPPARC